MIGGKKGGDIPTPSVSSGSSERSEVKAILGKGSEFEGKLRFEGTARVDGNFKGEVASDGTLIVGEMAVIDGDIMVDSAVIAGKINGNVKCKTSVELRKPAKLVGNIETPTLVIQEGVIFDGHCQMSKGGPAPKPAAKIDDNKDAEKK